MTQFTSVLKVLLSLVAAVAAPLAQAYPNLSGALTTVATVSAALASGLHLQTHASASAQTPAAK